MSTQHVPYWPTPSFWPALLQLPKGQLTTVFRPTAFIRRSEWATIVGSLILDVLATRQPLVYLHAGSPDVYGPADGSYELPERFLNILDVHATADELRARRFRWLTGRCEPEWGTVDALRHGANIMDERFGPAALILDNANKAIPGNAGGSAPLQSITDGPDAAEAGRTRDWADELTDLARSRPESPTIVVWSLDDPDPDDVMPYVLAEASVATIHVQKALPWGEVPMYVRTRAALGAEWSAPRLDSPEVLDWGFEERDLDEHGIPWFWE